MIEDGDYDWVNTIDNSELKENDIDEIKAIGAEFLDLLTGIGDNRELSLAKTKIQEAMFWAELGVSNG